YPVFVAIVVGVIWFICLVLSVWYFKSKCPTPQQTQTQTYQEVAVQANETEEELHYGNLGFLQGWP
ncbi:hypothetical protein ATANTOWER_027423, partial [Ataeniobius toweri]|nr:hypothetical protein [Ataeniobius toweri]